jgi:hypothetical protein
MKRPRMSTAVVEEDRTPRRCGSEISAMYVSTGASSSPPPKPQAACAMYNTGTLSAK